MNRRPHSAEGHTAAGRLYGKRGARPITRAVAPMDNTERRSRWAAEYQKLPALERRQVVAVMPTRSRPGRREAKPARDYTGSNPLRALSAVHDKAAIFQAIRDDDERIDAATLPA